MSQLWSKCSSVVISMVYSLIKMASPGQVWIKRLVKLYLIEKNYLFAEPSDAKPVWKQSHPSSLFHNLFGLMSFKLQCQDRTLGHTKPQKQTDHRSRHPPWKYFTKMLKYFCWFWLSRDFVWGWWLEWSWTWDWQDSCLKAPADHEARQRTQSFCHQADI